MSITQTKFMFKTDNTIGGPTSRKMKVSETGGAIQILGRL